MCPLCGAALAMEEWWRQLFQIEFPQYKLATGELAYHLKIIHGAFFLCPCFDKDKKPGQGIHELMTCFDVLCAHYESIPDVEAHIQFHALSKNGKIS